MAEHRSIALRLSYITVAYNLLEGVVSVAFAFRARSPALLGFGVDSFVESLSGMIMVWRFSRTMGEEQRHEQVAIRLAGASLIILAAYVAYDAIRALHDNEPPSPSIVGLIVAAMSLVVMPTLYLLKRKTAAALDSRSLLIDAK